jgi:hypothetical protein
LTSPDEGDASDVLRIDVHVLVQQRAALARHLPQAGDAGTNEVPGMVDEVVGLCDAHQLGAGANEAHVAFDDIEQLRQLVEAPLANETADRRVARIVEAFVGLPAIAAIEVRVVRPTVVHHRPELDHAERLAVATDALLAKEDVGTEHQAHREGDTGDDRKEDHETEERTDEVDATLEESIVDTDNSNDRGVDRRACRGTRGGAVDGGGN